MALPLRPHRRAVRTPGCSTRGAPESLKHLPSHPDLEPWSLRFYGQPASQGSPAPQLLLWGAVGTPGGGGCWACKHFDDLGAAGVKDPQGSRGERERRTAWDCPAAPPGRPSGVAELGGPSESIPLFGRWGHRGRGGTVAARRHHRLSPAPALRPCPVFPAPPWREQRVFSGPPGLADGAPEARPTALQPAGRLCRQWVCHASPCCPGAHLGPLPPYRRPRSTHSCRPPLQWPFPRKGLLGHG